MIARFINTTVLASLLATSLIAPAAARAETPPPLRENDYINSRLLGAAVGDEIRKNCPSISPRYVTFLRRKWELERYALDQGYTREEIVAYVDSKVEQRRMNGLRDEYLKENGVVRGDSESYCRLGREEIAAETYMGTMLKEH
ncbi:MAG: DUF5333 domain-containing protein [Rhodobacteraceae bacterium]|nr:DUF5333 domain-containing protein [Paracoccaceae bacterium]